MSEQRQLLVGLRSPQAAEREQSVADETSAPEKRWGLRLPSLRGKSALAPTLDKAAREERAEEKEREKLLAAVEAAEQAFYRTPAGRARLAYKRGHQLFQYELEVNGLEPTVIPGHIGSPAMQTTDPVDILNSVMRRGLEAGLGQVPPLRDAQRSCRLLPLQALAEAAPDDEQPLAGPQRRQLSKPLIPPQAWS